MTQRIDGTAFISGSFLSEASILIDGDTITYAGPESALPSELNADEHVRHDGLILPGLVDIHCHGGGGFSFPDTGRRRLRRSRSTAPTARRASLPHS